MPGSIFYIVLNMSVASCVVIVVLFLVRLIKPIPRRYVYPMWALAFLRLVMPFIPSSGWSLFNFTGGFVKRIVDIETVTRGAVSAPASVDMVMMNAVGAVESYDPVIYKAVSLRRIFSISSAVWAVVAVCSLFAVCLLYTFTYRELRKAVHVKGIVYSSEMVMSPVLTGVFRPRIILPPGVDPESTEGKIILEHENVHRKRLDNLWRALAVAAACVHWFNPLVWLMLRSFFRDMELSCDETVLKRGKYGSEGSKAYAAALLQFAENRSIFVPSAFGSSGVRVRIVNVLNFKRMTVIGAVASAIFLLAVAFALITNPSFRG